MVRKRFLPALLFAAALSAYACSNHDDPSGGDQNQAARESFIEIMNETPQEITIQQPDEISPDVRIQVNGKTLKKSDLQKKIRLKMKDRKASLSSEEQIKMQKDLAGQFVDNFITRVVFSDEADRLGLRASQDEIDREYEKIQGQLPPNKRLDDYFRENDITHEDIVLDIRIRKLMAMETAGLSKPSKTDIERFYEEHRERFVIGRTVHVRHILLALNPGEEAASRQAKKKKIEEIRSRLTAGEDFAELAALYSDCPSKEKGGDLGLIKIGQTVRPFEKAAFSQEVMAIGEVVSTEYGHHIIQVIESHPEKVMALSEVRDRIAEYLAKQNEMDAFAALNDRLRKKAVIVHNRQP
ncbi:MAG: Foldase protein PrsA 1 precursor [Candidatus Omnitrophica bacterium ADurb.Bin277]|nr:MAG: Foldase protein PrsA 1 precursor [Candidatus Omnitrophica bacterium ADurb.Bin277]